MLNTPRRKLTPPEVGARYGISQAKVLTWIAAGELRAFNAATRRGGRPRWLIDLDDLQAFEQARAATPRPAPAPRRKRRKPTDVIEFF